MRKFVFTLDSGEKIEVKPPKIRQYDRLLDATNDKELIEATADITGIPSEDIYNNWTVDDISEFFVQIQTWVNGVKNSDPN